MKRIIWGVLCVHVLLLGWVCWHRSPPSFVGGKPIKVRTTRLTTSMQSAPKPRPRPSKQPLKRQAPKPALSQPRPRKSTPSQAAPKQVTPRPPPLELLKNIDEALAKIETTPYPSVRQEVSGPTPSHEIALSSFLREQLQLPEVGEVTLSVTLSPGGKVVKLVVLESESMKNRRYLEEQLPSLHFPMTFSEETTLKLTFYSESFS